MEEKRDARGLTEQEAIERYRKKNYPRPALTADLVIWRTQGRERQVLLIRRGGHPFLGRWALPGGFANENEPLEATAARELREETGAAGLSLKLVGVFSAPGRDPRGWTVSAAYMGVAEGDCTLRAGDDAARAEWFTLTEEGLLRHGTDLLLHPEELAFDHGQILACALRALEAGRKES